MLRFSQSKIDLPYIDILFSLIYTVFNERICKLIQCSCAKQDIIPFGRHGKHVGGTARLHKEAVAGSFYPYPAVMTADGRVGCFSYVKRACTCKMGMHGMKKER